MEQLNIFRIHNVAYNKMYFFFYIFVQKDIHFWEGNISRASSDTLYYYRIKLYNTKVNQLITYRNQQHIRFQSNSINFQGTIPTSKTTSCFVINLDFYVCSFTHIWRKIMNIPRRKMDIWKPNPHNNLFCFNSIICFNAVYVQLSFYSQIK